MKLYEVSVLDDTEEINYLTVSSKTQDEIECYIKENGYKYYDCFITCTVREIIEIDGYRIKLEKIHK